ncbi:hypothetical protein AK830_g12296 [Neonectria ditissima]|uniref:Uncharacterized protein n=1 Tax=Neonectria ditissima TaxID=78410 RepID=A0A0N8H4T6_9HYPO|nr:hypothetical protein AK830_g12296 [Neonectria ditissima]
MSGSNSHHQARLPWMIAHCTASAQVHYQSLTGALPDPSRKPVRDIIEIPSEVDDAFEDDFQYDTEADTGDGSGFPPIPSECLLPHQQPRKQKPPIARIPVPPKPRKRNRGAVTKKLVVAKPKRKDPFIEFARFNAQPWVPYCIRVSPKEVYEVPFLALCMPRFASFRLVFVADPVTFADFSSWVLDRSIVPRSNMWCNYMPVYIGTCHIFRRALLAHVTTCRQHTQFDPRLVGCIVQWTRIASDHLKETLEKPTYELNMVLALSLILTTEKSISSEPVPVDWPKRLYAVTRSLDVSYPSDQPCLSFLPLCKFGTTLSAEIARGIICDQVASSVSSLYYQTKFTWLNIGNINELTQIDEHVGCSREILYILATIPSLIRGGANFFPTLRILYSTSQWWEKSSTEETAAMMFRARTPGMPQHATTEREVMLLMAQAWRLPVDHPAVVYALDGLAECLTLLPLKGYSMKAVPALFAFLLGMLGTSPDHKTAAAQWVELVQQCGVRKNVNRLADILNRVWAGDRMLPYHAQSIKNLDPNAERLPWWDMMLCNMWTKVGIVCLL